MNVKWKLFISSGSTQSSYKKLITVEIWTQSDWWDWWENGESVISHTSSAWEWRIRCLPYLLSLFPTTPPFFPPPHFAPSLAFFLPPHFALHPTTLAYSSQHATPIPSLPILSNPDLHSTATLVMHNHRVSSLTFATAIPSFRLLPQLQSQPPTYLHSF